MTPHKVYIALGSNLESPRKQIDQALAAIAALPHTLLIKQSQYFETLPMGYLEQDNFINAVCYIHSSLEPHILLEHLQAIEHQQRRVRTLKNGPRTIDCDILMIDDLTLQTDTLTVPHPGLLIRDFVLLPLRDIAPNLMLPNGLTVSEHYPF